MYSLEGPVESLIYNDQSFSPDIYTKPISETGTLPSYGYLEAYINRCDMELEMYPYPVKYRNEIVWVVTNKKLSNDEIFQDIYNVMAYGAFLSFLDDIYLWSHNATSKVKSELKFTLNTTVTIDTYYNNPERFFFSNKQGG